ncbi:MAG: YdeI/OmpD-associated family protein [Chitinophagales bacterium]|nr:YdeI/OmpD-associated family protein [Chitinophagales bacterium]
MEIKFFKTPGAWHDWLKRNHDKTQELWVGFYKKDSGKPSITWPESVDEALCFGWIDGIRKSIDEESYKIRFTPRKSVSTWSNVNMKRVEELIKVGRMQPAGLAAYNKRHQKRSGIYAFEQSEAKLSAIQEKQFKANKQAWTFFKAQAPWYQRTAIWWVVSAKREETKVKRLGILIQNSDQGLHIPTLRRNKPS